MRFFEETSISEMDSLVFAGNQDIAPMLKNPSAKKATDKYWGYIKQLIAFVPGVWFIHVFSFGVFQFEVGLWSIFFLVAGIVMIWMGMGDLKNKKHFLLPLSSLLVGLVFAIPFSFLSPASIASIYIYVYLGIFPLMFMAPVFSKGILEYYEEA